MTTKIDSWLLFFKLTLLDEGPCPPKVTGSRALQVLLEGENV
jgi:hypothetical protein